MTPVRGKRSRLIHLAPMHEPEQQRTLCGVRLKSFIVEPDGSVTCERCHEIATFN